MPVGWVCACTVASPHYSTRPSLGNILSSDPGSGKDKRHNLRKLMLFLELFASVSPFIMCLPICLCSCVCVCHTSISSLPFGPTVVSLPVENRRRVLMTNKQNSSFISLLSWLMTDVASLVSRFPPVLSEFRLAVSSCLPSPALPHHISTSSIQCLYILTSPQAPVPVTAVICTPAASERTASTLCSLCTTLQAFRSTAT